MIKSVTDFVTESVTDSVTDFVTDYLTESVTEFVIDFFGHYRWPIFSVTDSVTIWQFSSSENLKS